MAVGAEFAVARTGPSFHKLRVARDCREMEAGGRGGPAAPAPAAAELGAGAERRRDHDFALSFCGRGAVV